MQLRAVLICAMVLLMASCGYKTRRVCDLPLIRLAPAPGLINHVVFFDLQNPEDAEELIQDCYDLLTIPGATSGYAGTHYDIGRSSVLRDYDVGFFVAFSTEDDYRAYVEHPWHVALVEKWKPRWDSIRVYDIGDARSLKQSGDQ